MANGSETIPTVTVVTKTTDPAPTQTATVPPDPVKQAEAAPLLDDLHAIPQWIKDKWEPVLKSLEDEVSAVKNKTLTAFEEAKNYVKTRGGSKTPEDPKMVPAPTKWEVFWSHVKSIVSTMLVAFGSYNIGSLPPQINQAKQVAAQVQADATKAVDNIKKENTDLKAQVESLQKPVVVRVEPGTLVIKKPDGTFEVRSGGTISWRYNNPGKIGFNAFAKAHNAIGFDGPLAVFATLTDGYAAFEDLFFGSGSEYANMTLVAAIRKFAPMADGYDQKAYVKSVLKSTKLKTTTVLKDMTVDDRAAFLSAIQSYETFEAGQVKTGPTEETSK